MANEKRLIDANKLKTKAIADADSGEGIVYVQDIDEAPTVDAVEVVHTKWVTDEKGITYCGRCRVIDDYASVHNYCPNCGAKMDGDGNE